VSISSVHMGRCQMRSLSENRMCVFFFSALSRFSFFNGSRISLAAEKKLISRFDINMGLISGRRWCADNIRTRVREEVSAI